MQDPRLSTPAPHRIIRVVLAFVFVITATLPARSIERTITADQAASGSLLFRTIEPGRYVQAPLVASDIQITVTGPIVRATVTQTFVNSSDQWLEGVYTFPLPEDSAVDTLRMRIGDRFVQGKIEERKKARKQYEAAKRDGKRASLVEQQRPNIFQNSVANIGPGEIVVTQIEYQQSLALKDGKFSLRMPLVVAPRYTPLSNVLAVAFGEDGWGAVSDAAPAFPVADPRDQDPGTIHNPVTLSVELAAGFEIGVLESHFHKVNIDMADERTARVDLTGPIPANRDFELTWAPAPGTAPKAALFQEPKDGDQHMLLMLTPPTQMDQTPIQPREVIFVQDVSGSMDGTSIRQARAGLKLALESLRPQDRFNIIIFNDGYSVYSQTSLPANEGAVEDAIDYVEALQAGGGTNMLPALEWALDAAAVAPSAMLPQVIFLTDGAISNETELFAMIQQDLGRARLFTVGIGSAPNGHFMTRAAEFGRGASVTIGDVAEVKTKMQDLFSKIETPALTDISLELPGGVTADLYPTRIPDLYVGEPVVVALKGPVLTGTARLIGTSAQGQFAIDIPLDRAASRKGVAKLWARRRIKSLEGQRVGLARNGSDAKDVVDATILKTALDYHLTSRMTSLIAVDDSPARDQDDRLTQVQIAANLPHGWNPDVFLKERTDLPEIQPMDPATEGRLFKINAPADAQPDWSRGRGRKGARANAQPQAANPGAAVPRGSLNWQGLVVTGLILILIGGALVVRIHMRPRGEA